MKFKVTLKSPDGVYYSIREAATLSVETMRLPVDEAQELIETRTEELLDFSKKWIEGGEYLTVEMDTEAGTCVVVEN